MPSPKLSNYNRIVKIPSPELFDCNATTHTPSLDITRNHDIDQKVLSILTKGLGHEKHMLHLTSTFNYSDLFYQVLSRRYGQNGQMSIKMAMA
jgi:hypothetical protein